MPFEGGRITAWKVAFSALVRFLPSMNKGVPLQIAILRKWLVTLWTIVLDPSVGLLVAEKVTFVCKYLRTQVARYLLRHRQLWPPLPTRDLFLVSWFFSTEHFPFPKERDNAQFRSIFLQIFMLRSTFHLPQDLFFVSPLEPCCLSVLVISSELWNGSMGMGMGVGMTDIQNFCVWTDGPSLKYRQGPLRNIFACVRNDLLIHQLIPTDCPTFLNPICNNFCVL